jgi:DNA-binding transcriptional ArsR family regulator
MVPAERASRIAGPAGLLADDARVEMLLALLESGRLTVTDLAARAEISLSTASAYLGGLAEGGFVTSDRLGRMRLYRVSHPGLAAALEALAALGARPNQRAPSRLGTQGPSPDQLARSCYDHLAGRLGVGVTEALLRARLLTKRAWSNRPTRSGGYALTKAGAQFLRRAGVDTRAARASARSFAHPCMDRTERRPHLAGALGAAMAQRFAELGWVARLPGTRALRVTPGGRAALRRLFGLEL